MSIKPTMRSARIAVVFLAAMVVPAESVRAQCTQVFAALNMNGIQYPVQTPFGIAPPVVAGVPLILDVQFRSLNETVYSPVGSISLRYTVDNQSVGPVLRDDYSWQLDTANVPDGSHAVSVRYVDETPQMPCVTFVERQYSFVVANGGVRADNQRVPAIVPPQLYGPVVPQYADFITYPGFEPHAPAHPLPAQTIPPAGGVKPADLWAEPLVYSTAGAQEAKPAYWQLANGSIVEEPLLAPLNMCDDLRVPGGAFDITSPVWELRKSHFDGGQDDASLSSFTVFAPNADGPGFYGISMEGRLLFVNTDGSLTTLAGPVANRSITPYYYLDNTIPLKAVRRQQTMIGDFDLPFNFPTDVAIDPTNHSRMFVADMNNNRIAVVNLSQTPPTVRTYAGVPGQGGYLDGPEAHALFNQPSSIAVANDGTVYVADAMNGAIRAIDREGNVTTLVGQGPLSEPGRMQVARTPLTYAPRTAVPFASAYINYPNTIRFDSKGNLVLGETVSETIRYIDLVARTVTTIAQLQNTGIAYGEQQWLDVDRKGNVGPVDDVIVSIVRGANAGLYRVPITGTTAVPPPTLTAMATNSIYSGHTVKSNQPWTASPWSVAIDDEEGRLVVTGMKGAGMVSLRLLQPADPAFQMNAPDYVAGRRIWFSGTVPNFPFGSRPSFATVHGFEGHSGLGNVKNFDDLVAMSDTDLGAYLQSGAEGSVPRPEITGNDLRNLIYYIRRTATGGSNAVPGPTSKDVTAPTITNVVFSQIDSTTAIATWITNEPTIGLVQWGTASGTYFGWSPIESTETRNHSVTFSDLPAGRMIYFIVRSKDDAGNQTAAAEQSVAMQ